MAQGLEKGPDSFCDTDHASMEAAVGGGEIDGDVGGLAGGLQTDGPTFENNSGVLKDFRLKSTGREVTSPIHASKVTGIEMDEKAVSTNTLVSYGDENKSWTDHESKDSNGTVITKLIQQNVDGTISSSADEGLFVLQLRNPASMHSLRDHDGVLERNLELHSCNGATGRIGIKQRDHHGLLEYSVQHHEGERGLHKCLDDSVVIIEEKKAKLDEKMESSVAVIASVVGGLDTSEETGDGLTRVLTADMGSKTLDSLEDHQQAKDLGRSTSGTQLTEEAPVDEYQGNMHICSGARSFSTKTTNNLVISDSEVHSNGHEMSMILDHNGESGRECHPVATREIEAEIVDDETLDTRKEERVSTSDGVGIHLLKVQLAGLNGCEDDLRTPAIASGISVTKSKDFLLESVFVEDLDGNQGSLDVAASDADRNFSAVGGTLAENEIGRRNDLKACSERGKAPDKKVVSSLGGCEAQGLEWSFSTEPSIMNGSAMLASSLLKEASKKQTASTEMQGGAQDVSAAGETTAPIDIVEDVHAGANSAHQIEVATKPELVTGSSANLIVESCDANIGPIGTLLDADLRDLEDQADLHRTEIATSTDDGGKTAVSNFGDEDNSPQNIQGQTESIDLYMQHSLSKSPEKLERDVHNAPTKEANVGCEGVLLNLPSEIVKVYVRKRKRSISTEMAEADMSRAKEGSSRSVDESGLELKGENPDAGRVIKHYVRRPHQQTDSQSSADVAEKSFGHVLSSLGDRVEDFSLPPAVFQRQMSARVGKELHNPSFQRNSKRSSAEHGSVRVNAIDIQETLTERGTLGKGYLRSDHQPDWLPEGWTLEIRIREAGTTAGTKDKYYHDPQTGHKFRSKNEVLQYLEYGKLVRGQAKVDGVGRKGQSLQKRKLPVGTVPAKRTDSKNVRPKSSLSTSARVSTLKAPNLSLSHLHPARMKSTPLSTSSGTPPEANGTDLTWAHVEGPNGPIWLPWGGSIMTGPEKQGQVQKCSADAKATAESEGAAKIYQLFSSSEQSQLPTGSSVPAFESATVQGEKENRGKLVFRLKRKQPESEAGKGRSKRPMYEVIHGGKASSSTSSPTQQGKRLISAERTNLAVLATPIVTQTHGERSSLLKEPLCSSAPSCSISAKAQVGKHIPMEEPMFNNFARPFPVRMPTVELPSDQSLSPSFKAMSFERMSVLSSMASENPSGKNPRSQNTLISNWSGQQSRLDHQSQQPGLLQQEPYTALGIPATARASGLQQMAPFSANHSHVFMHPVENTIPLSWQYPFTSQASIPMAASMPTLGPFRSAFASSVSGTFSIASTVPIPVFEHFPVISSSMHFATTSSLFPYSELGVDSRARDSAMTVKLAEGASQMQKFVPPRALTKSENSKLLQGLGRRLCQAGLEQKARNQSSLSENVMQNGGTLNSGLNSQALLTSLEGKNPEQGILQNTSRMH